MTVAIVSDTRMPTREGTLMINGWLVLDIAAGIVVGGWLRTMVKDTEVWWDERRANASKTVVEKTADDSAEADWQFLWDNVPESAKEGVRKLVDDDQLRLRAQELNVWPYLWSAAPEDIKEKLRYRWKALKIPPRFSG
jgi:hypothetical protein